MLTRMNASAFMRIIHRFFPLINVFSDILGNNSVKRGLIHAVQSGHLHHALLFAGPAGIGKAMIAKAFVQAVFCKESSDNQITRCRKCSNCHRIENGIHPDVLEIVETAATLKIEVIRDLQSRLVYAPFESSRRFVIIHDIHKMQDAAANCFLKTLEEPPQGTTFILLTDQMQRIIPTIISRCQVVRFAPFSIQEITQFLIEKGTSTAEAAQIAAMSGGSLGQAIELSTSDYKTEVLDAFESMLETDSMLDAFSSASGLKGKKNDADALLKLMAIYIRDMLVLKTAPSCPIILSPYRARMMSRLDKVTEKDLHRAANIVQEVSESFQGNGNELLTWERLMLGMHQVLF